MASRSGPLRALSSVSLIGALVEMGEAGVKASCEEPVSGCCHESGAPASHNPVRTRRPGPAMAAAAFAADTPTPSPVRAHPSPGRAAAPAAIQGVGFFKPVSP